MVQKEVASRFHVCCSIPLNVVTYHGCILCLDTVIERLEGRGEHQHAMKSSELV